MTALLWDAVGERNFESGIDRGVLYSGETGLGVAWNGLTSLDDKIEDTATPLYQDGVKYVDAETLGSFAATLRAFTYPDEFEQYEGLSSIALGFGVSDQPPKRFHLAYRTMLGDDVEGTDYGYQIHILYNLVAVPDEKAYNTLTQQTVPMRFSWTILGVPVMVEGFRPTAHIIIDSTDIDPDKLLEVEDILYGTDVTEPHIPTIEELVDIVAPQHIIIIDHGDGTWSAIGPDELITMLDANTFQITEANATYSDPDTYEISDS